MRLVFAACALALLPVLAEGAPPPKPAESPKQADDDSAWDIPEAARDRPNPLSPSAETLRVARVLWRTHCETCHGVQGRGDGPNARLHERRKGHAPRNLTDPNVQENLTDGEIFFRVSKGIVEEGNIIMPSFETKVPEETQRWQLVLFVRELGRAGKR